MSFSVFLILFLTENTCLQVMRAVRLNQNSKFLGCKIKIMSLESLKRSTDLRGSTEGWVIFLWGLVTVRDPSHITLSHLNHGNIKSID